MAKRPDFEAYAACFWNTFRGGREPLDSGSFNQNEEIMAYYELCKQWKTLICKTENDLAQPEESQPSDTSILYAILYDQMSQHLKAFLKAYEKEIKNDFIVKQAQSFYHLKAKLNLGMKCNKEAAITQLYLHQKSSLHFIKKEAEELLECLSGISTEDEDGMLTNYSAQLNALIVQRQKQLDEEEIDDHFLRA